MCVRCPVSVKKPSQEISEIDIWDINLPDNFRFCGRKTNLCQKSIKKHITELNPVCTPSVSRYLDAYFSTKLKATDKCFNLLFIGRSKVQMPSVFLHASVRSKQADRVRDIA
jgi:hypothetical protein